MTDNTGQPEDKLHKVIEKILNSDAARRIALKSDNPLVKTAARLSDDSTHPQLSVTAKAAMLQQVLDAMPQPVTPSAKVKSTGQVLRPTFWSGLAKLVAGFIVVMLVAGLVTVPASANSLPGDALYPVKRQLETVQIAIARSPEAQAELYLTQAQTRLEELDQLANRGDFEGALIDDGFDSLNESITLALANDLYEQSSWLVAQTDATFAIFAATISDLQDVQTIEDTIVDQWENAYDAAAMRVNDVGFSGIPGDHGCGRPGNACNAPGHTNSNGNGQGNGNGNANGNANGNSNGGGNANGNSNGRGRP